MMWLSGACSTTELIAHHAGLLGREACPYTNTNILENQYIANELIALHCAGLPGMEASIYPK
jgi:hypothetical protein